MEFLDKVSHACLVKIEVASHADAYTLFESLNNRGMPLTAIDLIKNKLLARLESIEPGKVDHYFGTGIVSCYSVTTTPSRNASSASITTPSRINSKRSTRFRSPLDPT